MVLALHGAHRRGRGWPGSTLLAGSHVSPDPFTVRMPKVLRINRLVTVGGTPQEAEDAEARVPKLAQRAQPGGVLVSRDVPSSGGHPVSHLDQRTTSTGRVSQVDHLAGRASEDQPSQIAAPSRAHHDDARIVQLGILDDLAGGVPGQGVPHLGVGGETCLSQRPDRRVGVVFRLSVDSAGTCPVRE